MVTNGLLDLIEAPLELTHTTYSNVAIAGLIYLVASVAVLVSVSVEPEGESALGILLHPLCCQGNAVKSSEEVTDMVGGIGVANMAHQGWIWQPLQDSLTPFHNSILKLIIQEKLKDLLGDVMGGIGRGRIRNNTNLYYNGTETPLLLLFQQSMGEEVGRVNG
ncbi:hypothetical protein V8E55_008135 [Tylopilus felleus]